jgi:hypothetical protein
MKRSPKIWQTEDEILAAIDKAQLSAVHAAAVAAGEHAEEKRLVIEAAKLADFALTLKGKARADKIDESERCVNASRKCNEAAKKATKRHKRLTEVTLPHLKDVLATFRTETMPDIMQEYKGVAIR